MPSISIYALKITKEQLSKAPVGERNFFLLMGLVANELNVLSKHGAICMRMDSNSEPERAAYISVSMFYLRMLAGKLTESWGVLREGFAPLHGEYHNRLSELGRNHLKTIKKYFGKKSAVEILRNKIAFHFDANIIDAGFDALPQGVTFTEYLGSHRGNNLYSAVDSVLYHSIHELFGGDSVRSDVQRAADEILALTSLVGEFAHDYMRAFLEKHFNDGLANLHSGHIVLADAPYFDEMILPYYFHQPRQPILDDEARVG